MGGLFTHAVNCRQFQLFELRLLLDVGGKITAHFVRMFLALKIQEQTQHTHTFKIRVQLLQSTYD